MNRPRAALLAVAAVFVALAVTAAGQSAGVGHFTAGVAIENGGLTRDGTYTLIGQVGGASISGRARGAVHEVTAGFPAIVDPVVSGPAAAPWPMGVTPCFIDLSPQGDAILTLHGAELLNGGRPALSLGGRFAPIIRVTGSAALFAVDRPVVPGWQKLDFASARGTVNLLRAVGVRPLLALAEPAAPDRPVQLVLHARSGDTLMLAATWGLGAPQKIAPFHHTLQLNRALWIFLGSHPVTDGSGRLAFTLPSIGLTTGIHLQGLVLNVGGPYRPGSFTNTLAL